MGRADHDAGHADVPIPDRDGAKKSTAPSPQAPGNPDADLSGHQPAATVPDRFLLAARSNPQVGDERGPAEERATCRDVDNYKEVG